jgi:hypothetical protein
MASIVSLTYDFISLPWPRAAFFSSLMNPISEKWDNHGHIGLYLGPTLTYYQSYHCFIDDTNATRICDRVMFYLAPLVLPGASGFDQLLQLTERLVTAAESQPPAPKD